MAIDFGKAHYIWERAIRDDETLTDGEVKEALKWFDEFCSRLSDKASQSEQIYQESVKLQENEELKEEKWKVAESDRRQLYVFIKRHDDLVSWHNAHQ